MAFNNDRKLKRAEIRVRATGSLAHEYCKILLILKYKQQSCFRSLSLSVSNTLLLLLLLFLVLVCYWTKSIILERQTLSSWNNFLPFQKPTCIFITSMNKYIIHEKKKNKKSAYLSKLKELLWWWLELVYAIIIIKKFEKD